MCLKSRSATASQRIWFEAACTVLTHCYSSSLPAIACSCIHWNTSRSRIPVTGPRDPYIQHHIHMNSVSSTVIQIRTTAPPLSLVKVLASVSLAEPLESRDHPYKAFLLRATPCVISGRRWKGRLSHPSPTLLVDLQETSRWQIRER